MRILTMYNQPMRHLEGLLFAWGEALSLKKLAQLMGLDVQQIKEIAQHLGEYYEHHESSLQLIEVNQSLQLATRQDLQSVIEPLFSSDKNKGLSISSLEALSIIAYKQPITKQEIERIRGVKCDRPIQQLLEVELIRISGKLDRIGKPNLFSTTDLFLKKFGLKSLRDLPPVESFERLQLSLDDDEGDEDVQDK
jgi:segregation and condensation protein B